MKIFALGDQGNLSKGIDNKIIKALTKQAGRNVIGLTQSFTEEKKGLDFSPRSGEATSGEK